MKQIKSEIFSLFPYPVYLTTINKRFDKKELNFFKKKEESTYKIIGNISSLNTYVLNEPIFKNLKKEIDLIIKDYFNKIICPKNNIVPYITQSWLNYTDENQFHHKHCHPNSLISGVLYINADEKNDKIIFFNEKYERIEIETMNYNLFNSKSWWFPVKTGNLILFPSNLKHMVEVKKGSNTRTSLAFNVFIKGKVGNNRKLTELIL
jgi:uncharacterized protein (TIGR02466 family)